MSSSPARYRPRGHYTAPDAIYRETLREYVAAVRAAIAAEGPRAAGFVPPPAPPSAPVVEDILGGKAVLVDPPRDAGKILKDAEAADRDVQEAAGRHRRGDVTDEWSCARFGRVRALIRKKQAVLERLKPAPLPVAHPFIPSHGAALEPHLAALGGYLETGDLPVMADGGGAEWARRFMRTSPEHQPLNARGAEWTRRTATLRDAADLGKRSPRDEWRREHFGKTRAAANARQETYASGRAVARGGSFFAEDAAWSRDAHGARDEYHASFFASLRRSAEEQNRAFGAVKADVPEDVFAPAAPDATEAFRQQEHAFGPLRDPLLAALQQQDPAALQASLQRTLREKLATLSDRDALLRMLDDTQRLVQAGGNPASGDETRAVPARAIPNEPSAAEADDVQ